jgi:hypothetical protein
MTAPTPWQPGQPPAAPPGPGVNGQAQWGPAENDGLPGVASVGGTVTKPGLDSLVNRLLYLFQFAVDTGGEAFLLPKIPTDPYIPRSFLTRDVLHEGHVTWRLMAKLWNAWLETASAADKQKYGSAPVALTPSDTVVRNAAAHLEALAVTTGRRVSAALRSVQVQHQGRTVLVIDLGDKTGKVAYCTEAGWSVIDPRSLPFAPPVFRRSIGYSGLPHPVKAYPGQDGDLAWLWGILRTGRPDTQALAGGWLVAAYFADVPRPGLWTTGPPGAGKTTAAGGLARLIDGLDWLEGKPDKSDERNNIIRAVKNYVPSFDNITALTGDLSDWICGLVTGRTDTFRRMRTNFDDVSMTYRRTFVATGLALPGGLRADALDRVTEAPLDRIPEAARVSDEQIRATLEQARPQLLGAVLDHVCGVLRQLPNVPADTAGLPRMHGYARLLLAHDREYRTGWLDAYRASCSAARADKADAEPVVAALLALIAPRQPWHGMVGGLLEDLKPHRPLEGWWPSNARALGVELTNQDPVLEAAGIHVERNPKNTRELWIYRAK